MKNSNKTLTNRFPEIAALWHPTKNGSLQPQDVTPGSEKNAWWLDTCGHEYDMTVTRRVKSSGCPFCALHNARVLIGFNDLTTTHPMIAASWHPTLNGELKPEHYTIGSHKKVFWIDEYAHEWQTQICERLQHGCPICAGKKILIGFNDLSTTDPELALEWHPNNSKPATAYTRGQNNIVKWLDRYGHEWPARISARALQRTSCPICTNKILLPGFNDLQTRNPEAAMLWHPSLNGTLKPTEILAVATQTMWWTCEMHHDWDASVRSVNIIGKRCPFCSGRKGLAGFNSVADHPVLSLQWHTIKNDLLATDVAINSTKLAWWQDGHGHEWQSSPSDRAFRNHICPICAGLKVLVGFNDLASQRPDLAAEWATKLNATTPDEYTLGSGAKVWWCCVKEHSWEARIVDRVHGTNCPICSNQVSRGEILLADFLAKHTKVIRGNRKLLHGLELDIYLPEHKIGVEYNGVYWHAENRLGAGGVLQPGKSPDDHNLKRLAAESAGIQLIQIWEDDWREKQAIVESMLLHKINRNTAARVYARSTQVKTVTAAAASVFLQKYHIQGAARATYHLGLFTKNDDELVAIMSLRNEKNKLLEIVRYATSKPVPGGFTKILAYSEKQYKPQGFVTFSDNTISDGGLYANNGFIVDKELPPDYMYVINGKRKHKFGYRLRRFRNDPNLIWEAGFTEQELALRNNLFRIWDAGKLRWVKYCR